MPACAPPAPSSPRLWRDTLQTAPEATRADGTNGDDGPRVAEGLAGGALQASHRAASHYDALVNAEGRRRLQDFAVGCDIFDATACAKDSPETVEVIRRTLNKKIPAPFHVALDAGLSLSVELSPPLVSSLINRLQCRSASNTRAEQQCGLTGFLWRLGIKCHNAGTHLMQGRERPWPSASRSRRSASG